LELYDKVDIDFELPVDEQQANWYNMGR
jgi:hypothetical protein